MLAGLIDGSTQGQGGRVVHRVTAAVLHGQMRGPLTFILDHTPADEPGLLVGSVGVSLPMYAALTGPCVYGSAQRMERLIDRFGWPGMRGTQRSSPHSRPGRAGCARADTHRPIDDEGRTGG